MRAVTYRREFVGSGEGRTAVALVAGFAGGVKDFLDAATALAREGYDVFIYEYTPSVLTAGRPNAIYELIDAMSRDFLQHAGNYPRRRYAGVSMGGGIAWNMQKRDAGQLEPGLYGAAGADVARIVFHNPLFRQAKRAFVSNGYSEVQLHEYWRALHEPPHTPFIVALGASDFIVRRREVMQYVRAWQQRGLAVMAITNWRATHSRMIRWYRQHILELSSLADQLALPSASAHQLHD